MNDVHSAESSQSWNDRESFVSQNYSNLGVGLLGLVMQKKTGLDLDGLVQKYITTPLNMPNTFKDWSHADSQLMTYAHNDLLERTDHWALQNVFDGAGALKSTTEDMVKYIRAQINPESTSIAEAILLSQRPRHIIENKGIALGWGIKVKDGKTIGLGHGGGTGGYATNVQIYLQEEKGLVSFTNSANGLQCAVEILMEQSACEPKLPRIVSEEILNRYLGFYQNSQTRIVLFLSRFKVPTCLRNSRPERGKVTSLTDYEFSIK